MIENELLLLGLLKDSPKHGYEIKLKIQEIGSLFAGIDFKSIYYPLRVLEKKGLVTKRANKSGRRPQRLVYQLTSEGQARFEDLVVKSLLDFKRPQFSLDLSLYFLHYINPRIARRRLQARMFVLERLAKTLRRMTASLKQEKSSPALAFILEHNIKMVQTESEFLGGYIKDISLKKAPRI